MRARELSAAERALWRRVAATVRPMRPEAAAPPAHVRVVPPPAAPPPPLAGTPPPPARPPKKVVPQAPRAPRAHLEEATLDGGWDRRARTGRLAPDAVIDLHGHGLAHAHDLVEARLRDAAAAGARVVLVITGKGSRGPEERRGLIRRQLPEWLHLSRLRPLVAAMRPAHPRHGGAGAFYVVLRRPR